MNIDRLSDEALGTYLEFAGELADLAAKVTLPRFRDAAITVTDKGELSDLDPVTEADRQAEDAIRDAITSRYPDHAICGEERGYDQPRDLTWFLDPIDGTRSFISGAPMWGTLIGLMDRHGPLLGLMDQPFVGERFVGSRLGATVTTRFATQTLATRACTRIEDAIVCSTHPGMFEERSELDAFKNIAHRARMTRFGGDCYNYCLLAYGFVDVVIESGLKPHDVVALIPMVEAAGGVISDWRGGSADRGGRIVASGDRVVHEQLLSVLGSVAD